MSKSSQPVKRGVKDTRGLPTGLDPRYFYEYSSMLRRHSAVGIERFLYLFMPYNLIKSLAFAIDPLRQFKTSTGKVSPPLRIRIRKTSSALGTRTMQGRTLFTRDAYKYGAAVFDETPYGPVHLDPQEPLINRIEDSTRRTRVAGSDIGELSIWKVDSSSPGRTVHTLETNDTQWPDTPSPYWYRTKIYRDLSVIGPSAVIYPSVVEQMRLDEWARTSAVMSNNVLSLFSGITAQKKVTTLYRNIVELKDLPRGIIQLGETLRHLRQLSDALKIPRSVLERIHSFRTTGFDIPKEYLSYQFGWRQTFSDVMNLLAAPERFSKRINFLIRRNGQPTTYRRQRVIADNGSTSLGFNYSTFYTEDVFPMSHEVIREHTIKMVVNTTFEFPGVDMPNFRKSEFIRQLGVVPSPTDLYNLVPWTWLVDWFTGLGNYVEVIDSINQDRELINWGLITCVSKGSLVSTLHSQAHNYQTHAYGGTGVTEDIKIPHNHQSTLSFLSMLRRDVSGMLNVNTTADPLTLSAYQQSILGSILLGSSKFR